MHGRSAIWFPLALLALLAALTFWIERTVQPPQPKRDGSSRHDPDYIVSNFVMNKADRDGNPRSTLAAVSMVHFPDDDSTELVRPRYTQFSLRKPTVQIQGQRGQVASNGENVYFMDNVKAVREATKTKGELIALTELMHVIPEQEIASTDRPVRILQMPHTVVTGTGMEMNNKQHTFKLFHNVRVHYERPGSHAAPISKPTMDAPPTIAPKTVAPRLPAQSTAPLPKVAAQKAKGAPPQPKAAAQHTQAPAQKQTPNAAHKPVKKSRRNKPRTETTNSTTEKSGTRIRRHYENNTHR